MRVNQYAADMHHAPCTDQSRTRAASIYSEGRGAGKGKHLSCDDQQVPHRKARAPDNASAGTGKAAVRLWRRVSVIQTSEPYGRSCSTWMQMRTPRHCQTKSSSGTVCTGHLSSALPSTGSRQVAHHNFQLSIIPCSRHLLCRFCIASMIRAMI